MDMMDYRQTGYNGRKDGGIWTRWTTDRLDTTEEKTTVEHGHGESQTDWIRRKKGRWDMDTINHRQTGYNGRKDGGHDGLQTDWIQRKKGLWNMDTMNHRQTGYNGRKDCGTWTRWTTDRLDTMEERTTVEHGHDGPQTDWIQRKKRRWT